MCFTLVREATEYFAPSLQRSQSAMFCHAFEPI